MLIKSEASDLVSYPFYDANRNASRPQTSNDEFCRICANQHDGVHFGVLTCRACSAFFRRSIVEDRLYTCKEGRGQCQIKNVEQRKMCRSCRLNKCIEEGMQKSAVQIHREPLGGKRRKMSDDLFSAGSNPYSPHSSRSPQSLNGWTEDQIIEWKPTSPSWAMVPRPREQRPMLSRLSSGIENWDLGQKYLITLLYPNSGTGMRQAGFDELSRLDRASVGLVSAMIEDFFPLYGTLPVEIKQAVMPKFVQLFRVLERSVKNERLFGGPDSGKTYVQYGHYIDIRQMVAFFKDERHPEAAAKAVGKLFAQARPFNDKICTLKLRDPEIAALSAIVLWSLIGECTNNECFETYRDRIFAELHEEMLEEYGEGEAPTRQMELAHLLSSLNFVNHELDILHTTTRLFNLFRLPTWEDWHHEAFPPADA